MARTGLQLWTWLRSRKRAELDKLELELIRRPFERRDFAGDPAQRRVYWVPTRNRKPDQH